MLNIDIIFYYTSLQIIIGGFIMPFDGAFTRSIVKELSSLINCKIEKIHQPTKDEIVLIFKKDRKAKKVLCCANPSYPRVHITEQALENPKVPPTFCMILRKYLLDGILLEVNQINFDRIIELRIESRDELGYPAEFYIVTEIMGKHSNIILLNKERKIVDSIKHIGSNMNRYREVLPGCDYVIPPIKEKVNPLEISTDKLQNYLNEQTEGSVSNLLTDKFLGVSKPLSKEICGEFYGNKVKELSLNEKDTIISSFLHFMTKIKSMDFKYIIFYDSSSMFDYYICPLEQYSNSVMEYYDSPGSLLDVYYSQKNLKDTLKQKFNDIFKLITNLIERNSKKIQIHISKLEECKGFEEWKIYGDLIMANQYVLKKCPEEAELENFYDPNYSKIKIKLDVDLTSVENAQKYYKRYAKEKSTIEVVKNQLKGSQEEQIYLESILFNLENATDVGTIEEIKSELWEHGYIKRKIKASKQQKTIPYHYKSSDGYEIYVGKNNNQNDYLTTKFAVSSDMWMHTKNIPGSHVIIKSKNGGVSETALTEGAKLAAYYSKSKNSTNVPVDYTEKKNVKKPSGAKPGMVIYYTNKTIYVTPDESFIKEMKTE